MYTQSSPRPHTDPGTESPRQDCGSHAVAETSDARDGGSGQRQTANRGGINLANKFQMDDWSTEGRDGGNTVEEPRGL